MSKILFVDDEPNVRLMYDAVFSKDGYATLLAGSGDEALKLVEANADIDLVVLDIKMKDRSGLEVLQDIVKQKRKIPVILCSAYSLYKDDFSSWLA
jgi:CheY-like chemotaxis protein